MTARVGLPAPAEVLRARSAERKAATAISMSVSAPSLSEAIKQGDQGMATALAGADRGSDPENWPSSTSQGQQRESEDSVDPVLVEHVPAGTEYPKCSSSRQITRISRPSPGIDRLTLWFPTAPPHRVFTRDLKLAGIPESNLQLTAIGNQAGIAFNPSSVVYPCSVGLSSLAECLEVARDVWSIVGSHIEPNVDLESARVTRIDLSRNFFGALDPARLIMGLAYLHRPHGGDTAVWFDAKTHQAKSLSVGSKTRRVILYDKTKEAPGWTAPGTLRWELQARSRCLRLVSIETAADLTPERIQQLFDDQWRWSQMETPVVSTPDLFEFVRATDIPEQQRPGILWALHQRQHGGELTNHAQRQLAKFVGQHGIPVVLGAAPVESAPTITEWLNWETGTVVTTLGGS